MTLYKTEDAFKFKIQLAALILICLFNMQCYTAMEHSFKCSNMSGTN